MKRFLTGAVAAVAASLLLVVAGGAATLPGGTSIEAAVTGLTDHQVLPDAPLTIHGTASVGVGQAVANTTLIYIVDVSGSTANPTGGSACPNQNVYDLISNTTLDCELLAVRDLNAAAIATGTVAKIGLIGFAGTNTDTPTNITSAAALDLDFAGGPAATLVAPNLLNDPGARTRAFPAVTSNLDWVVQSAYFASGTISTPGGWGPKGPASGFTLYTPHDFGAQTNYTAALIALNNLLSSVTTTRTQVVFLSDGQPNLTVAGTTFLAALNALPTTNFTVDTFAITGAGSTCGAPSAPNGTLEQIAQRYGKHCVPLSNPDNAISAIPSVIASSLTAATLKVDGAAIPTTVSPALPQTGPRTVALTSASAQNLAPGDHVLCATASGTDGGGSGSSGDNCITVTIKAAPTVTLTGGDGPNGEPAGTIDEGSSFDVGANTSGATPAWSSSGGTGHCTFADPSSANTSVTCDDNGLYTLTLTLDDGVNPPVSASEHLQVDNVPPTPTLTLSAGPHPLAAPVGSSVAISDPGTNDTFTCTIDWGDGSPADACGASHTYAAGGTYLVTATATDDDFGVGHDAKSVTVNAPPTIDFGDGPGRDGSLSGDEGSAILLSPGIVDDGTDTFAWSYAPGAGVDAGATCSFGNSANASTSITCTDDGDYTLTLRVDDGVNPAVEGHAVLHVANVAPIIPTLGATTSGQTATVTAGTLDAGANDTVECSFDWGDGNTDAAGSCTRSHTYAAGVHSSVVTVTATDDDGGSSFRTIAVSLNRPPSCDGVAPSQTGLWPPDHTLRLIVLGGATDADHDPLTYAITSVRQDEPTNGLGDGDTAVDAVAAGPGAVRLRAERSGTGDGRVYTIAYTVSDGHGGSCTGTATVTVAKSASKPAVPTPGPGYDSFH